MIRDDASVPRRTLLAAAACALLAALLLDTHRAVFSLAGALIPAAAAFVLAPRLAATSDVSTTQRLEWLARGVAQVAVLEAGISVVFRPLHAHELVLALVLAPVIEESLKFLISNRATTDPSLRIAALVCVAGGFSAIEDLLYLANASQSSYGTTWVLRSVFTPLLHIGFSLLIPFAQRHGMKLRTGLVAAIAAHTAWNTAVAFDPSGIAVFSITVAVSAFVLSAPRVWSYRSSAVVAPKAESADAEPGTFVHR